MRLPLPRSPLTGALSAVAVLSLGGAGLALHTSSGNAASATTRTVTVSKGVVQSTASGTGNLAAANELTLNFGTSGTVEKVYVKEGEHVSQGQLIARLNSDSQEVALAEAKANLQSAEDAADTATTSTASASNADTATTTDAVLDDSTQVQMIDAADTTTTTPETTTPSTDATSGTAATTPSTSGTTGSTGTTGSSGSTTGSSTTATPSTSSGSTSTRSGSTGGSTSGAASGGSSGASGSSGGSSSGSSGSTTSAASAAAQVASDKLAVKEAQAALDDTELRAPVAGTIVSLDGSKGDSVSAGSTSSASSSSSASGSSSSSAAGGGATGSTSTGSSSSSSSGFATLSQLSKLSMSVSFSESDIGKVKVGQAATVSVSAVDGVKLAARVTKIGLVASTSNSVVSYPVELTVTQNATGVRAGMSATAEIVVEQATGVLNVPTQALSGKSVTVVKNGEKTTQQVTTGIVGTSTTQIVSGLTAGDVIALPTLSAASTSSSTSSTSNARGSGTGTLGGGTAGGFGGGTGGGFAGGAGGPPTR